MNKEVVPKRVFIQTWGCQMNVRDSEVIGGLLKKEGFAIVDDRDKADIIIFNTCSVRQHAEDKVWSEVGRYKKFIVHSSKLKDKGQKQRTLNHEPQTRPIIGIVGCMAQNYKEMIFERSPQVDFVVGPSDIDKIPEILKKLNADRYPLYASKIWETEGEARPEEIYHTGFYEDKEHAYVVISEGCSNFCSYCVVPYVRGGLRNRNHQDILKEMEEAIEKGITRVTLLGQNVNAYEFEVRSSKFEVKFIDLLGMVNKINGLKEFGFITSHPKDTNLDLFKAMQDLEKLKKYLHLPVQSGSDRILQLMNRGYSKKFYLELVNNYRKIVKGGLFTTDVILGFPSETDKDFQETYDLVKAIEFDAAYIFKYSTRPHTEAARLIDDVPKDEKERRHALILELQKDISRQKK